MLRILGDVGLAAPHTETKRKALSIITGDKPPAAAHKKLVMRDQWLLYAARTEFRCLPNLKVLFLGPLPGPPTSESEMLCGQTCSLCRIEMESWTTGYNEALKALLRSVEALEELGVRIKLTTQNIN
jgi:hypothetical protein